jgi:hypothetical protein
MERERFIGDPEKKVMLVSLLFSVRLGVGGQSHP